MKKRKGYVSIIALIVMSVSMIMILDMIVSNTLQHEMAASRCDSIQSYYLAEGKVLMSLYEDKYYRDQLYPVIVDYFGKSNIGSASKSVLIDGKDLEGDDTSQHVRVYFPKEEVRKTIFLVGESNYKGIVTSVKSSITLLNEVFEIHQPILSMDIIEDEYKKDLENLMLNIEKNITTKNIYYPLSSYAKETYNYSDVSLKVVGKRNYNLICSRETMTHPDIEGFNNGIVYIVIKPFEDKRTNFHIDCSGLPASLSGIMYIEGDLEITGDFSFNGIIIVKDGQIKVNGEVKPVVKGLMILYDSENIVKVNNEIDLQYDSFPIYKYGSFIPGFIDLDLKLIKMGEYD